MLRFVGHLLLRVLPSDFRRRYGEDVAEYFHERSREVHATKGLAGVLAFWIRGSADVVHSAVADRLERRHGRHTSQTPRSSSNPNPMNTLIQDITFALRTMRRAPEFTLVAVVTLALGIGVNVAMFATAHAVLIKPLPYSEPDRLVIGQTGRGGGYVSGPDFVDLRDQSDAFESLGAIMPFSMDHTITGGSDPERVAGTAVSPGLFPTLGVDPQLGRGFLDAEAQAEAPEAAIISHGYWQRRFGGRADAVGSTLAIDGIAFTVVGVMPAGFRFLPDVEFWRPMRPDRDVADMRDRHNWFVVGRLVPGVSMEQAQGQTDVIFRQLAEAYPESNQGKTLVLSELHNVLVADYRTRLYVLIAAVGLLLLLACANITGMLLARAPARRVELSTRAALGASSGRLVRQMLVETALMAVLGGVLGAVCAVWMQQVILRFLQLDLPGLASAQLSLPLLGLAMGVSLFVGALAGIYPALTSARGNLVDDLKAGARTTVGMGTGFRSALTVAQVAMSIVLLIGSALLIRSFFNVRSMDPGFSFGNLITAELELSSPRYSEAGERTQFHSALLEEVRAAPGVVSAGMINNLPIRSPRNFFHAYVPGNPEDDRSIFLRSVLPGYFESMGIRLQTGRDVSQHDDASANPVFVINSAAARAFFGDEPPLGEQLVLDFFDSSVPAEVVGVVDDVRMGGLNVDPRPTIYAPYPQMVYRRMQIAVRFAGDQSAAVGALRSAVRRLDRDVPVTGVATMESIINDSVSERRTVALSLTLYAALPLMLAAVGLYAVLAYYVSQRSHEIGLRMALGANGGEIAAMILKRGTLLLILGVAIGVAGGVGLTRLIRQMLFGVEPTDPITFLGVCLFVVAIALVACLVPAWRAVRVDPMVALQAD